MQVEPELASPQLEIRNPGKTRNPKPEIRRRMQAEKTKAAAAVFSFLTFSLSFGFRI